MRNHKILLVEDNPNDVALTLHAFKKSGVNNEIVVARDGEEALDYLLATGPHTGHDQASLPEVILLDLNLPKIDGLDVLKKLTSIKTADALDAVGTFLVSRMGELSFFKEKLPVLNRSLGELLGLGGKFALRRGGGLVFLRFDQGVDFRHGDARGLGGRRSAPAEFGETGKTVKEQGLARRRGGEVPGA